MGQYYEGTKIGTCEMMYYMTLDEALELAKIGAKDDDGVSFKEYLEDGRTKWRFPFPDERPGLHFENHARGFKVLGDKFMKINHWDIPSFTEHRGGGYGFNIIIPCPNSKDFEELGLRTSFGANKAPFLNVRMEAMRDGERKTIFECARCGTLQRFDDVDVARIKSASTQYYKVYEKSDDSLYNFATKIISMLK